jgi:hypothetical protein
MAAMCLPWGARFVIHDRDTIFSKGLDQGLRGGKQLPERIRAVI